MTSITLNLPDTQHNRLKNLADLHGISVHQLLDETVNQLLSETEARQHFETRANRGHPERGRALLAKALGE